MSAQKVDLDAYTSIDMWKSELARTARKGVLSKRTWQSYRSHITRFLKYLGWNITPDELIEEANRDVKAAVRKITEFKAHLLDSGMKMNNTITIANGGVQSFYTHNGIRLPRMTYRKETPQVVELDDNHSLHVYDSQTKKIKFDSDVLQDIAANISFRDQVAMLSILSTSQDPKDLFDLNVGFVRGKNGERISWAGDRQKTGERFKTFFSLEASRFLRKYVETERSDADDEDPLFVTDGRTFERKNPVTKEPETIRFGVRMNAHAFAMNLRNAQKKLGLVEDRKQAPFRPKRLRKLFRTACARAGIDEGYRLLFMGHSGNVSSGYLETPKAMLEAEYARLEPFVTIFKTTTSEDIDSINLDLTNTKDGLSQAKEDLGDQKTQIIKLYERMEVQRQRNETLRKDFVTAREREIETTSKLTKRFDRLDAFIKRWVRDRMSEDEIAEMDRVLDEIDETDRQDLEEKERLTILMKKGKLEN